MVSYFNNIFTKEESNSGRQFELDVAKAFAIFLMIMGHCLAYSSLCINSSNNLYLYLSMYMGMAAPIFLFSMGVTMSYTRNKTANAFIKRGIYLLLLGLFINFLYFLSDYLYGVGFNYSLISLLCNDVLQFAGLSFILIGILKKFNLKNSTILIIALIMSIIGSFINGLTFDNLYLTQLIGNIIGTYGYNVVSAFPLLNWFLITVGGLIFGTYLRRCSNKREFYKKSIIPLFIICLVFLFIFLKLNGGMFDVSGLTASERLNFFNMKTYESLYSILYVIFVFSVIYFIIPYLPNKLKDLISFTSKNITIIYVIQWIVILSVLEINTFLNIAPTILTSICTILGVFVISLIFTKIYIILKSKLLNSS